MLTAFVPARFRGTSSHNGASSPSYLNRQVSAFLQSLSRRSCTHPIHTIVFVALLASTSYIGLLEGSLFKSGSPARDFSHGVDLDSLTDGGRSLKVGQETGWKWLSVSRSSTNMDNVYKNHSSKLSVTDELQSAEHLALLTLVFPNSLSDNSPCTAPLVNAVPILSNSSAEPLPSTSNRFSPISQDTTMAFSVRWDEVFTFLNGLQQIPEYKELGEAYDGRIWVMKANRSSGNASQSALRNWATNAWIEFVDLLKVRALYIL